MKILLTSPYPVLPANSGGAVRTINIARALQQCGHEVHVLSASNRQQDELSPSIEFHSFADKGTIGHFFNTSFMRTLNNLLKNQFDLVVAGFPYQAWMLAPALRRAGVPFVYDAHNVEADRFQRMHRPWVAAVVRAAERKICRTANLVLTVSEQDKELLQEIHCTDSVVLPNGVDTVAMTPKHAETVRDATGASIPSPYILFFGGYDYPPNLEAAQFLLEKVWPAARTKLPGVKLALVGRQPADWMHGHPDVIVTGSVDDIVTIVQQAKVVVAPLFSGGGTRLKILEALACGKDILATPFGAMGIVNDSAALHLASPEQFAQRLVELVNATDKPSPVNPQARQLAAQYDWRTLVQAAEPALFSVARK